ncbi:DUF2256 domain-containing protein [Pandoraea morbifera]|nr:DUF2256 domain-containing protein [Pandoraea morbifera]
MHRKPFLPSKVCQTCGRPFVWRKRWARTWEEVKYCSERCRRHRAPA